MYSNAIPADHIHLGSIIDDEKSKIKVKTYNDYFEKISPHEIEIEMLNCKNRTAAINKIVDGLKKMELKKLDERYGIHDNTDKVKEVEKQLTEGKSVYETYKREIAKEQETFNRLNRKPDA